MKSSIRIIFRHLWRQKLFTALNIIGLAIGIAACWIPSAFQRAKEISIRKILGASMPGIIKMLSSDFVKLIVIALLVAVPVAWWAMDQWLADFAYRITIQWWMFGLAGLFAIAVALITVSYQSVRAALANPVDSLRNE